MRLVTRAEWVPQPWKNGRGVTNEVLREPDVDDYEVRISVAMVTESGAFSTFPGYRRWTLGLAGDPIVLRVHGVPTALSRTHFTELDGSWSVAAELTGTATLLNVLGKRGVRVGVGVEPAVDIVFALSTHEARVFDTRVTSRAGDAWIKRA